MKRLFSALPLALFAGAALAHPGHESASFFSGFGHPIGGADHLLAMLAVGLLAARQAGRARWALPAAFVLTMLAGAGLGAIGVALPAVETGIALSVLVLGLL
ncbi:MAG: HupE/UreJ family protein, partial [Zoogloeaceae bacterium]|nr:HupE/UreJ family protein [Zoogloeaceae bacterium]